MTTQIQFARQGLTTEPMRAVATQEGLDLVNASIGTSSDVLAATWAVR